MPGLHPESIHLIHHRDKEEWDNLRALSKVEQTQQTPRLAENDAGQREDHCFDREEMDIEKTIREKTLNELCCLSESSL